MPNRMLKDWTASERIDLLSPGAEIFFTRLIMKADDHGCFHGNPKLLNSLLFPLKEYSCYDVLKWRDECQGARIIKVYQNDGQDFVQIVDFGQRLRTMKSKFPQSADNCPPSADKEPPELEEKRREEELEEKGKLKPLRALPFESLDFTNAWVEWERYRKEKKQKLTESTAKKQIQFLGRWPEKIALLIIDQSIRKRWTGLFEFKQTMKPKLDILTELESIRQHGNS